MVFFVLWCQMRSVGFARIIVMLGPLGWPAATQECSRHSCEPGWVKINTLSAIIKKAANGDLFYYGGEGGI